jgi:hypothetical protein
VLNLVFMGPAYESAWRQHISPFHSRTAYVCTYMDGG